MGALVRDTSTERAASNERAARNDDVDELTVAYNVGYADGITLLRFDEHNQTRVEPIERVHARYLCYVELEHPTLEARAYVAGFCDVAADNLPCPRHEI